MERPRQALLAALVFYGAWTAATWFFEGRIGTLLRPEAVGDRIVYAFAVNLLLGIGGGIVLLRSWVRHRALDVARTGFRTGRRTVLAIAAGFALGLAAYLLQGALSRDPVVLVNAFAQVLVVSAAEVVVCWAVLAVAAESVFDRWGRVVSGGVSAVLAGLLFGAYHWAHSPPFDTLPMVALLSVVGVVTGAFFLLGRDVAGTVVFHNFLGTFGVVQALAAADALQLFERLQAPLLFSAALTAAGLAAGYAVLGRERA